VAPDAAAVMPSAAEPHPGTRHHVALRRRNPKSPTAGSVTASRRVRRTYQGDRARTAPPGGGGRGPRWRRTLPDRLRRLAALVRIGGRVAMVRPAPLFPTEAPSPRPAHAPPV